jgi:hypothetical protein
MTKWPSLPAAESRWLNNPWVQDERFLAIRIGRYAPQQQPGGTTLLWRRRSYASSPRVLRLWRGTRREANVRRELQALVLSLGALLAVGGSALLMLWAAVN